MSHGNRRRLLLGATIAAFALLLVACGGDDNAASDDTSVDGTTATTAAPDPVPGGKLIYGLDGETESWNPALAQWSTSSWLVGMSIFDPLVAFDATGEWKPFLAESITPNDDYTKWTITAREGVTFHNGEPFNADAMLANFEAQKQSPLLAAVMGPVLETNKVDDLSVELTMANSWVHFPYTLTAQPGVMMAPAMITDPEGASNPVGTGPFAFDQWRIDDSLTVIKNDDYWLSEPYLNEIEFRVIPDVRQRLSSLETGDIQALLLTGAPDALGDPPDDSVVYRGDLTEENEAFLILNQRRAGLDDLRLREALVLATDKQQIIDTVAGGLYEPAAGIWAPLSKWYVETDYPEHDPERAAELIAEIEEETGEQIELTITGPPWPVVLEASQLIQEQWEAAGVDVNLETLELTQYVASIATGNYEVGFFRFHGNAHPDGEFVFLHSQYAADEGQIGLNFAHNIDTQIDEALLEARYTDDETRLKDLYGTVQERLAADLPYVFLWHVSEPIFANNTVHGIDAWEYPDGTAGLPIIQGRHRFHQMWIEN